MKKVISLFLSVVMSLSITAGLDYVAFAEVRTGFRGDSEEIGNTVSYTFDTDTGILTISGKGAMRDGAFFDNSGFYNEYKDYIPASAVKSVKVTSTVTSIGERAFTTVSYGSAGSVWRYGMEMTSAILGTGIKSIGSDAFKDCRKLPEIIIPDACSVIDNSAFEGCLSLETVHLGSGLKTLRNSVFENDRKLTNINFPNNLETIGNECFYGCSSLAGDIVLQNKLSSIGYDAFKGCSSIKSITILNSDCKISQSNTTIPLSIAIIGHIGSAAQEYAETFGNEFIPFGTETTEIVPPTCTEQGYTLHTCDDCGRTFKDNFTGPLGHKEKYVAEKSATCTEDGNTDGYICSVCGEIISGCEIIPATGHTEIVTKQGQEPTCTEKGLTEEKVCSVCNKVTQEQAEINILGHDYVKTVVEPTCKNKGYTINTCTRCHDSFINNYVNVSNNHNYKLVVRTPATCTSTGIRTLTCTVCGDTYTETIAMKNHTSVVDKAIEPTCTKAGLTQGSHCSACGTVIVAQKKLNPAVTVIKQ